MSQASEQAAAKAATATEKAAQKAADAVEKGASRQRSSYEKLSHARETLGIRSEQAIQREIQHTEAAYNRLAASGTLSWRAQAAAADKMRQHVTQLTNEMGKLTAAQKAYSGLKFGAAGAAGVAAAAYTLKGPAEQAMSYDRRLAHMANTAYSERDAAGRNIGMKTLEAAVNKARRQGGGTREQAAEALDTMIASGTVSDGDAIKMLPGIMKTATASGADANELATIAIRAKQSFKIKAEDLPSLLSAAMAAGQAGGFELKNMSKWLPQQMAMAGNLGLSGKEGFAKLAAWNQASVITSGDKDEAGNNLRDLLMELNTPHFRKFMGDQLLGNGHTAKKGEKEKRQKDIDALFLDYQSKGIDKVSATMDMADKVFSKDKNYQKLQAKLRATGKDDQAGKREIIESMAAQVQGTAVGKIFHNQQSLMAFLGLMNNRQYTQEVLGKVRDQYSAPEDKSAVGTAYQVIGGTADYKLEQAVEDKKTGQKSAMDSLTPAIGKVAEAFSDLASKHPFLIGTTTLATTALGALAGAAGLASVAMGGKGLPGGGAIGRYAPVAMKAAKVGGIAGIASLVGDYALEKGFGEQSAITRYGSSALNGAATGATLGSIVPVLGTGVGAAVGGGLGLAWEGIKDLLKPAEQKPVDVNFKGQLGLDPGLVLRNQSMQASGGNVQMNTGNIHTGAP
ncbi:phage tail tape measure protein [Sulfurimicrobium lacus]|uniref:phage tail tape measure protein n=1 Tax=Sulfurimicrobium lacus TaxID=2715678 RepID=UPI0018E09F23|nr:phage tail tape measure protein [Sulfurimicrobium lacus]